MLGIKDLLVLLPEIMKAGEIPMLVGHAGVGKTEVIKEIGKKYNRKVIILALSQMEPGDLIGMPARDEATKKTVWYKPDWWPEDGNAIIFLDEINRSQGYVRSAVMQLLTDKQLHTHVLPEGTWICAAMNPDVEEYETNEVTDVAFKSRFIWLSVTNKYDDWLEYARKYSHTSNSSDYLAMLSEAVKTDPHVFKQTTSFKITGLKPTPRSHIKLLKLMNTMDKKVFEKYMDEIFIGLFGEEEGALLLKMYRNKLQMSLSAEDFFVNSEKVIQTPVKNRVPVIPYVIEHIASKDITDAELKEFERCFAELTNEEIGVFIREMSNKNNKQFVNRFSKLQKRSEVIRQKLANSVQLSGLDDIVKLAV